MARTQTAPASKPAPASQAPERSSKLPVFTCRHRALKAAVWLNESKDNGFFYNVTVSRSYKDDQDQWHESGSLGYDDVLLVAELLRTCHGFISRELAKQSEEARD